MADTPSSQDLRDLQKSLQSLTKALTDLDGKSKQVFERDIPSQLRRSKDSLDKALADSQRQIEARLNAISTKFVSKITGMQREGSAAMIDIAKDHAASYAKTLMGGLESGLSFGLPRILGPLAMIAGPYNQISAVQAENMKIAAQWGSAYGNILPGQVKATVAAMGNINLQIVQMSNKYRQSREDILATSVALARNTVVQKQGVMAVTEQIAAMSRLRDIPMAELTEQMITLTKRLNVEAGQTPGLYADIASYAKEAGMGTQFLLTTTMTLGSALARQGANIQDYAGYIAVATKNLEKLGMSERVAAEAAQNVIQGAAGVGAGQSFYMGQIMLKNLNAMSPDQLKKTMAQQPQLANALMQTAAMGAGGKAPKDYQDALRFVSSNPLYMSQFAQLGGGTPIWRGALNQMANQLVPNQGPESGLLRAMFLEKTANLTPQGVLSLMTTNGAFAGGATGALPGEKPPVSEMEKQAQELGRSQMSYYEKVTRKLEEIKTNTDYLKDLEKIAIALAIGQTLTAGSRLAAAGAKGAEMYKMLPGLRGPGGAGGIAEGVEGASAARGLPGFSQGDLNWASKMGGTTPATAAEEVASTAAPGLLKSTLGKLGGLGGLAGIGYGLFSGYGAAKDIGAHTTNMQATTGILSSMIGPVLTAAAATGGNPIAVAGTAIATVAPAVGKMVWSMGQLDVEVMKLTKSMIDQKDTYTKAGAVISKKTGFDFSALPEKDRAKAMAVYQDILTQKREGKKGVDVKDLERAFEPLGWSKDDIARILQEISGASQGKAGATQLPIINGLSGRVTIIIGDPGTDQANLNDGHKNTPVGSTGVPQWL